MFGKWYNKHTSWGIVIFGWLLVSIVFFIPVFGDSQNNRSYAATKRYCGEKIQYSQNDARVGNICNGKRVATATTPQGIYKTTAFGCSDSRYYDDGDNCHPAVSYTTIPECQVKNVNLNVPYPSTDKRVRNGGTRVDPARRCEETVIYFSANIDQYGRNALVKVTNPDTGQAVIVRAIDQGPHCRVQGSEAKFDMSYSALAAIGFPRYVKVEAKIANNLPVGPLPRCGK